MKKETRNVVVLDWEDKIKLQQFIKDLEQIYETYKVLARNLHVSVIHFTISKRLRKGLISV